MYLKEYQKQTLLALRDYLERARMDGPAAAYAAITGEPARKSLLRGYAGDYRPLEALPDAPYVCLRIPTGGGKTLLAAHAIALARDAWIEHENPLVLWLTPSDMIRRQTLDALSNPRHAYRQALDEKFGGAVRVFDIEDFTMMRPHDMRDKCCILVGTIQMRVKNTEGRKVYADNEELEPHFARLKIEGFDLEAADERRPKYSLANLLHVHRPLMIVDEAHNAVTQLSREMQKRVNPCAIVEFTATPRMNSNILYSVSAWELKDAEMIKLPIHLQEHRNGWRQTISAALATHALLAAKAAEDRRGYIRPIILFQAQPKDEEVTVEALKAHLIDVENVAPEKIAVATGGQRELEGVNLFDPACPVEFVITVEALREGWDCSFAYVLTSVSRIRSETSVEQLLGRVLRMPYAQKRAAPELNKAYAHVSEPTFADAARALKDCLTKMGFDEEEATSAIESDQFEWDGGLFAPRVAPPPPALLYEPPPAAVAALRQIAGDRLSVETKPDGRAVLRVSGWVTPELEAEISSALPAEARAGFCEAAASYRAEAALRFAPAQKGESFVAPALVVEMQGELRLAEHETFMEYFEWSLNDVSAVLGPNEFTPRMSSDAFELDVKRGGVSYTALGDEERMILAPQVPGWDKTNMIVLLDRQLRDIYFMQSEMQGFIHRALDHLTIQRGLTIPAIWMDRSRLAHALRTRIEEGRADARKRAYQLYLFEPGAIVRTSPEHGFSFHEGLFAGRRFQARVPGYEFRKHFLGPDRIPAESGPLNGEEADCALALESFDEVEFWLRNVPLREDSFWLPLASARFYPDFVAKLKDGRVFVVEYKGKKYTTTDDSREKRAAGALWERHGGGLFLMVEKMKHGLDMKGQIAAKLRG